jgi:2-hydroxychromene-2-carboxylate isomerase
MMNHANPRVNNFWHISAPACFCASSVAESPPMNKTQIRAHFKTINVSRFGERHGIPLRTLWRVKKRGESVSSRTLARVSRAIAADVAAGIVE